MFIELNLIYIFWVLEITYLKHKWMKMISPQSGPWNYIFYICPRLDALLKI